MDEKSPTVSSGGQAESLRRAVVLGRASDGDTQIKNFFAVIRITYTPLRRIHSTPPATLESEEVLAPISSAVFMLASMRRITVYWSSGAR